MLGCCVVDLVIAKAALRNATGDDSPEIILRTAFLEPHALESVMECLGLLTPPVEEGVDVEINVLALRCFPQLIQRNVGTARHEVPTCADP